MQAFAHRFEIRDLKFEIEINCGFCNLESRIILESPSRRPIDRNATDSGALYVRPSMR
jgi:hypothetical protein